MIKAFFFDLDGTLIKAPEEDFYETLREIGMNFPLEQVYTAYTDARSWYRESANDYRTGEELWKNFADQVLLHLGMKEYPPELLRQIRQLMDRRESQRLYPETVSFLTHLYNLNKYMGIISSRPLEGVEEKIKAFNLQHFFSLIIGRESVKEIKPSTIPFILALKESGFFPEEVIYVGDSIIEDLPGAQKVGIRTYIVDRLKRYTLAPYIIGSLCELLEKERI